MRNLHAAAVPSRAGFLLTEVAVAYVIVSLAIASLMTVLVLAIKANYTSEATLAASALAAELMEEVRMRKWDQTQADLRPGYPAYSRSAIGLDPGEVSSDKTTFNDIDDFDGWAEQPPKDPVGRALSQFRLFSRSVSVKYVTSALADSAAPTDYKLVKVCVRRSGVAQACLEWLSANP